MARINKKQGGISVIIIVKEMMDGKGRGMIITSTGEGRLRVIAGSVALRDTGVMIVETPIGLLNQQGFNQQNMVPYQQQGQKFVMQGQQLYALHPVEQRPAAPAPVVEQPAPPPVQEPVRVYATYPQEPRADGTIPGGMRYY